MQKNTFLLPAYNAMIAELPLSCRAPTFKEFADWYTGLSHACYNDDGLSDNTDEPQYDEPDTLWHLDTSAHDTQAPF